MATKRDDKATILIVDDKPANIFALEKLLERRDRRFLNATNGTDALQTVLNKDIDLIILDVNMPDMNGFEVAQILQSNRRTKDIPIIFASAEQKEHQSMLKGFEEGAVDYLFKPLDPEITKAKVAVLLKIQLQKKELIEKNQSLEKSALLINNSADIIGIIDAATLKIEEINNAFTQLLGYTRNEALGVALTFFLDTNDRARVQALNKTKDQLAFETQIYCKNRSIKWLHWHVVLKNEKWFVNARDITEIKQVEKIRNYLAAVVKQSTEAIYIHDSEGKIISWNEGAEKIYGFSEHEASKMKIWNIIPEDLQPETTEIINRVMTGEKILYLETRRITKHGKLIDVLFSASLLVDDNTHQKSIAITERDVTAQKIADEQIQQLNSDLRKNVSQLENANKELESFSYSVSHDLRAPLRALNGYSKMLEDSYAATFDDEARRLLSIIQANAGKMGTLIDDLLEFSRLGRQQVRKTQIDMHAMAKDIADETLLAYPKVAFNIQPLPEAEVDHALLRQVWVNLISNAAKYSYKKDHPAVEVGSYEENGEMVYYVKDNGAGFNMKYADKLFNVFQRLHDSNDYEGTGIGLAIVYRIITRHGGRVWATAEVDKGATFRFTLPK